MVKIIIFAALLSCDWMGEFSGMAVILYEDGTKTECAVMVKDDPKPGYINHWDLFFYPRLANYPRRDSSKQTLVLVRSNLDGTMTMILDGYATVKIFPANDSVRRGFSDMFLKHNGAAIESRWQEVFVKTEGNSSKMHLEEK